MHSYSEWLGSPINKASLDQAALWITKMDQGDFNEEAFSIWLHQSQDNSVAYFQLSEVWAKTACLSELQQCIAKSTRYINSHNEPDRCSYMLGEAQSVAGSSSSLYYTVIGLITLGCIIPIF